MHVVFVGGHLTPALATMDALVKRDPSVKFSFIGRMYAMEGDSEPSVEYKMMKEKKIAFFAIKAGRLQRKFSRYTISSLLRVPVGLFQSLKILSSLKPELVVAFGGYVAVPVVIAAWLLRIPTVTHEQTLIPGLANRIVSYFVNVMALSFEETRGYYENGFSLVGKRKIVVTGNPIRKEIFELRSSMPFGGIDLPMVYVTCGNQGSHFVNQLVFKHLLALLPFCVVLHQTGKNSIVNDFDESQRLMNSIEGEYAGRYIARAYIGSDEIGAVFSRSDVVVSRAGVNTLCDLLALGKKGIMIPGHKEQLANAEYFEKTGLGLCLTTQIAESQFVATIKKMIEKQVNDNVKREAFQIIRMDAAEKLAEEVFGLI